MISLIESGNLANTENNPMIPRSAELVGLSTDTKPTGVSVGNGWSFIEMDTGKVFFYNAADEEWLEFAGSGGGGGQGGSNGMIVKINWETGALDKTVAELYAAAKTGAVILNDYTDGNTTCALAYLTNIANADNAYQVSFDWFDGNPAMSFEAATINDYPVTADI